MRSIYRPSVELCKHYTFQTLKTKPAAYVSCGTHDETSDGYSYTYFFPAVLFDTIAAELRELLNVAGNYIPPGLPDSFGLCVAVAPGQSFIHFGGVVYVLPSKIAPKMEAEFYRIYEGIYLADYEKNVRRPPLGAKIIQMKAPSDIILRRD